MMDFPSSSLSLPFTFKELSTKSNDDEKHQGLLDTSFSQSQPRILKQWGRLFNAPLDKLSETYTRSGGVVVGSQDGTVYLFSMPQSHSSSPESSSQPSQSGTPSNPSRRSEARSRSSSSSLTSPLPFNLTRSKVVSGITTEQVEAPKNYVDFEEEPDKLKEMLKGRHPKDGREKQSQSDDRADRTPSPAPSLLSLPTVKRKMAPKSLLSTAPPSACLSTSPSSVSLPQGQFKAETTIPLQLWCHFIPPRFGSRAAVTSICLLEDLHSVGVLQEMGDISIVSLQDGTCLATVQGGSRVLRPPEGIRDSESSYGLWTWRYLQEYQIGETTLLLASAATSGESPFSTISSSEDSAEKSKLALFELYSSDQVTSMEVTLEKIGEWLYDCVPQCIGIHPNSPHPTFFIINPGGHLMIRSFRIFPRGPEQTEEQLQSYTTANLLQLPFKGLKTRSAGQSPLGTTKESGRIALDDERDLGCLFQNGSPLGLRSQQGEDKVLWASWSLRELVVFEYVCGNLRILYVGDFQGIRDIQWSSMSLLTVLFEDRTEFYKLSQSDSQSDTASCQSSLVSLGRLDTVSLGLNDAFDIVSVSEPEILQISMEVDGGPTLTYRAPGKRRTLWQRHSCDIKRTQVASSLPLDLDVIVAGCADGSLRQFSLTEMFGKSDNTLSKESTIPLNGSITVIDVVRNSRTNQKYIVGGADDGSIAFWTLEKLELCARWTVFITPIASTVLVPEIQDCPLEGCMLCISEDGTIAVIVLDGFQLLFLVPGSAAPLRRICVNGNSLLLIYADRRARLWDVKTQEFWRSMNLEKVNDLLEQGGWTDLPFGSSLSLPDMALKRIPGLSGVDAASTLILDVGRFTAEAVTVTKSTSTNREQSRALRLTVDRLRCILSALLTPGLSDDIDAICTVKLGLTPPRPSRASIGSVRHGGTSLYHLANNRDSWCLSADVSAARALSLIIILNALGVFEEYVEATNTLTVFYATSLADCIGPQYKTPSLVYVARRWFDGYTEVGKAARTLFDYTTTCLSDEESLALVEHWQHCLPCLQPTADRESLNAALALFLCGYLAAERYSLLHTSTLTDVSKSVMLYLHDEKSTHRVLAVDLCSRGFHVWQHYVDAMEILRSLFVLATTSKKDSISTLNIGSQARLAVLQLASTHTGLFMTTLGLDIIDSSSADHCKSVLQIVAYLIRKRPLVLQPNIPKLLEAVVRSLDPTNATHREAVLEPATEIIGNVVKTFPSVDFYMATQRLAVGTNEGAVIMYDVKTAIRLYVLEGHKKPISACSFSPDGRRLVTLSLEERVVLIWKVGSSFVSFFYPGAPPRQGHSGSEPFKTFNFHLGDDEGSMNTQAVMDHVSFEWVGDRSVKLKLRETVMTFST